MMPPADIFARARNNPIIKDCLDNWLDGSLSWEQALVMMVCELDEKVQEHEPTEIDQRPVRVSGSSD